MMEALLPRVVFTSSISDGNLEFLVSAFVSSLAS